MGNFLLNQMYYLANSYIHIENHTQAILILFNYMLTCTLLASQLDCSFIITVRAIEFKKLQLYGCTVNQNHNYICVLLYQYTSQLYVLVAYLQCTLVFCLYVAIQTASQLQSYIVCMFVNCSSYMCRLSCITTHMQLQAIQTSSFMVFIIAILVKLKITHSCSVSTFYPTRI